MWTRARSEACQGDLGSGVVDKVHLMERNEADKWETAVSGCGLGCILISFLSPTVALLLGLSVSG